MLKDKIVIRVILEDPTEPGFGCHSGFACSACSQMCDFCDTEIGTLGYDNGTCDFCVAEEDASPIPSFLLARYTGNPYPTTSKRSTPTEPAKVPAGKKMK